MNVSDASEVVDFLANTVRGYWPEEVCMQWIQGMSDIPKDIGTEAARQLAADWKHTNPPPWGIYAEHVRAAFRSAELRQDEARRGRELPAPKHPSLVEHLDWLHERICSDHRVADVDEMKVWQKTARGQMVATRDRARRDEVEVGQVLTFTGLSNWFLGRNLDSADLDDFYGVGF